jgi:hypothetical protein
MERHHRLHKEDQIDALGEVYDDTSYELPSRYHESRITSLQNRGYGSAYTAGTIMHDELDGTIEEYWEDEDDDD